MPPAVVFVERLPFDLSASLGYLDKLGIKRILLSDSSAPHEEDPDYDIFLSADLYDATQLEAAADRIRTQFEIQFVLGFSETSVLPAAYIASRTGANGISLDTARKCRNKLAMRERLAAAKLAVPRFKAASVIDHLPNIVDELGGFPIMCKPLLGFASQGVQKTNTIGELREAFRRIRRTNKFVMRKYYQLGDLAAADQVLLEEFLPGEEFAVDGFVHHGEVEILLHIAKPDVSNGPYFADSMHIAPATLTDGERVELDATVESAVRAMGLETGPFHMEVRRNPGGVFVLEVGARIGFPRLVRHTTGYDIVSSVVDMFLEQDPPAPVPVPYQFAGNLCINAPKAGLFEGLSNLDAVRQHAHIAEIPIFVELGDRLSAPPESNRYIGFVISVADTYNDVEDALTYAKQALQPIIR